MIIPVIKEDLLRFLQEERSAWMSIGGGPNLDAIEFEPDQTDPDLLKKLGYYANPDAWISSLRIQALTRMIEEIEEISQYQGG